MVFKPFLRSLGAVLVAALVASCGGGGGGGASNEIRCLRVESGFFEANFDASPGGPGGSGSGAGAGAGSGEGAIQYATVNLYDNTGELIGTAESDAKGLASLRNCGSSGPFRVEYVGNERTRYFDEGIAARTGSDAAAWVPFGVGERITAYVTDLTSAHVALTPVSHAAAAEIARATVNAPLTATIVNAANENAVRRFNGLFVGSGLSLDSTRVVPSLAYSIESLTRFGNDARGRYGQMLAALARSAAQTNPSLPNPGREMNKQLALDFADGILDGADAAGTPVAPPAQRAYFPQQVAASVSAQSAGRLTVGGTAGGTVARSLGGTTCSLGGGDCFPWATTLTLTPQPEPGFSFQGWSGACSGTATCTLSMTGDKSVSATFAPSSPTGVSLVVTKAGTGSGTVTGNPAGINCGATCSANFALNTSVTLTAAPAGGSTFGGWSGACTGTASTCVVSMSAAMAVTATFVGSPPTLTVTKSGTGSGTVTSGPPGINCGATCSADFALSTSVTLTAMAASGSTFGGWSGACTGTSSTCVVSMSAARSVTATFNGPVVSDPTLTVTKVGTGSGTVSSNPAGINCGATCSASFALNTSVTLSAAPASGSTFGGWSGACTGTVSTCVVSMSAARTVTATFNGPTGGNALLTVTKAGTGGGTLSSNPVGINCGATCSASFALNTLVTLSAAPASGSTFGGWSGACTGTASTCVVTMSAARTATATFNGPTGGNALLTVTKAGLGAGTVFSSPSGIGCGSICSATFASGTSVRLTASPAAGSTFGGWSGDCAGSDTTCTVTMTAARNVTATFHPPDLGLTVLKAGTGQGTVTSSPVGIDCGTSCSATNAIYAPGTLVTLTASPALGSLFGGWSGACSGTGTSCSVTMSAARSVTATFSPQPVVVRVNLMVLKTGTGSGNVRSNIGAIDCGSVCADAYDPGTTVTLTATPDAGASIARWTIMVGSNPATVVTDGRRQVGVLLSDSTTVTVEFALPPASWTWMKGSSQPGAFGVYGIPTVFVRDNVPGARSGMVRWTDSAGTLWMFGGEGNAESSSGYLSDVWRYVPSLDMWAWMAGPKTANGTGVYGQAGEAVPGTAPGARTAATGWIDATGRMWLFGGYGYGETGIGYLDDLWRFDPATRLWTWVGGSKGVYASGVYGAKGVPADGNHPGARGGATSWIDAAGDLWMFGGATIPDADILSTASGPLAAPVGAEHHNDLWRYRPSTGQWTWMGGSNLPNRLGVYGARGVPSVSSMPGGRSAASSWIDATGTVWMFGGWGYGEAGPGGDLNDLWSFDPPTGAWRWVQGSRNRFATGVYGDRGISADVNVPGARAGSTSWIDAGGNLRLFGGFGYDPLLAAFGSFNDLWYFSTATGRWTWVDGANTRDAPGAYGGAPGAPGMPGARSGAAGWSDASGQLWLFGGETALGEVFFNDLWRRGP